MVRKSYVTKTFLNKVSLWKDRPPLLGNLDIELTERCNNNCVHCYINLPADDTSAREKELSTEQIKDILREAVSLGCIELRFTGGEPLLRVDFEELYIFARKLGLKVTLFTNATLITPGLVRLFIHIPPLRDIEISLYGMKKSTYEAISRVSGSYKAAWNGINLLLKNKVPFIVKAPLLPQNKSEMEEFESWRSTIPWEDESSPFTVFFDLRGRRDNIRKNELIKRLRMKPKELLRLFTIRKGYYRDIEEMKEFCRKFMRPQGDKLFFCGSGRGGCVDAYGYFQPCMMLRDPDMVYDLKKGTLQDALKNFFPKMKERKATNPEYLSRCAKCFLVGLCEQCPAKSWMEQGTLDTPVEYLCRMAHAEARYFGLLKDGELAWEVIDWQERVKKFYNS